mmetsp:Transcript_66033/g.59297  ORF Transcript_66033/g.59297 Transcript_66033/m.59297 type:complete len:763 (+) Transcript_66033:145-2433(+)
MEIYYKKLDVIHLHGRRKDGVHPELSVIIEEPLETCDCDLFCKLIHADCAGREYLILREYNGKRRTISYMQDKLLAMISRDWVVKNRKISERFMNDEREALRAKIESMEFANQTQIRPYTNYAASPRSETLVYPRYLFNLYKRFDHWYLNRILGCDINSGTGDYTPGFLATNVWQEVQEGGEVILKGVPWASSISVKGGICSLKVLALRVCSVFNRTFGGSKYGPRANFTLDGLEQKIPTLLKKFQKRTHTVQPHANMLSSLTGRAMVLLYDKLGVDKYKSTQTFKFEESIKRLKIPTTTSAGNMAGIVRHTKHLADIRIVYTVNGKKVIQDERSDDAIRMMVRDIRKGQSIKLLDRAWVITYKSEVLYATNGAEEMKFPSKVRIYLIPTTTFYKISKMVHGYRQIIERGDLIQIGINWWNGGAYRFANRFRYNSKRHIRCEGDFRGLDTSLKMHYLMLYVVSSDYYYNKEGDYDIYKAFLKIVASNLSVRVTHLHSGLWRIMAGMMPSGAYETSHGDSWIVALIFFQYFVYTMIRYPEKEAIIMNSLKSGDIDLAIYGDDFHWMIPESLHSCMNIDKLHDFVSTYLEMQMRDTKTLYRFLSVPDNVTGSLAVTGATYLSRYFIHVRDLDVVAKQTSLVVPYRDFYKTANKFAFGLGYARNIKDHILASIGMAYDTFGTNFVAYSFCKFMFDELVKKMGTSFDYLYEYLGTTGKDISGVLRKVGVSPDQLKEGFPSRSKLLSMHSLDVVKHYEREAPDIPNL